MPQSTYKDRHKLTIKHWPELKKAVDQLAEVVLGPGRISSQLKDEIFTVASLSAGCRHCQSHGAHRLGKDGVPLERIHALWDFERSDLFSKADKAALTLARDAGLVPNLVTPEHFENLRLHFSDEEIREILAVIGITGFFNRYTDTIAHVTDQESVDWATKNLSPVGWELGKHRGTVEEQSPNYPPLRKANPGTK